MALAAAGYDVVVYDDLSAGHRGGGRAARARVSRAVDHARPGRHPRRPLVLKTLATSRAAAVMHFAARLLVGESVAEPLGYYRDERDGHADRARRDGRGRREALRLLVHLRDVRRAADDADRRDASAAADQRVRRDASSRSSARCRTSSARSASAGPRCGTSTRPAPIPDGLIGEDHDPEEHLIPRAIAAAVRAGPPLTVFGDDYPTPDGTCIRDYVHVSDLADAHVAALRGLEAARPRQPTISATGRGCRCAR